MSPTVPRLSDGSLKGSCAEAKTPSIPRGQCVGRPSAANSARSAAAPVKTTPRMPSRRAASTFSLRSSTKTHAESGRPVQAVVFKAGHHGSDTSSTAPFLAAVQPQIVVVSVGAENNFGHPSPAVLERLVGAGAAVLRTDQLGTIEVITDGEQMWWQAQK